MKDLRGKKLLGKVVVSEEEGKKFGVVGDVSFITNSGELLNMIISEETRHVSDLNLERNDNGNSLIPFSAVKSVGDFVIVSEKDIV